MTTHVHLDYETYSEVDLTAVGAWVYSRHPSTRVLMASVAMGHHPPRLHTDTDKITAITQELMRKDGCTIHAFNSFFECCIAVNVLGISEDDLDFSKWDDTMARACAAAWPQSLGMITSNMGIEDEFKKGKEGKALIKLLCMPQKAKDGTLVHPREFHGEEKYQELMHGLGEYCLQDAVSEREVSSRLRPLSEQEHKVWEEDQKMNWRGIKCDVRFAARCFKMYRRIKDDSLQQATEITGLANVNSGPQLKGWLESKGFPFPNLQSATIDAALEQGVKQDGELVPLPDDVRKVLSLRGSSSRTPPMKFKAMLARADRQDHNIRGFMVYHAASTGRWASRGINTLNLPRPIFNDYETAVALVNQGKPELLELFFGSAIGTICSLIRPALIASPGNDLFVADYSSIESRVLNWVAGAEDTLEAIRQGDAEGDKSRGYKIAAGGVFDMRPEDVAKGSNEYQGGKAVELACGYEGGRVALDTMANNLKIEIKVPDNFREPEWLLSRVEWENKKRAGEKKKPLSKKQRFQLYIVMKWREANPCIPAFWKDCNEAAVSAVRNPGRKIEVGKHVVFKAGKYQGTNYLWIRLPSGRLLSYVAPRIRKNNFGNPSVHFFGTDSVTRQWCMLDTYGGKLTENIVQAIARDLLAESKLRLADTVYRDIVMSVYDEIVCDTPSDEGDIDELCDLLCVLPKWAKGLPLQAAGTKLKRYWK